jgi:Domain of unknown function (DUF4345)
MSKRGLQFLTLVLAAIPLITGVIGMWGIRDPLYASARLSSNVLLDSNLRFFSGAWFGLGVALCWIVPAIEKQTMLFRVLWGMIFLGGIGRLISMLMLGFPPAPFIAFTALEILGAPLMIFWQAKL